MKKILSLLFLACFALTAFSQLNMTLMDQLDYPQNSNDVWGWVDPDDGTEYALVGLINGVSIVELNDPTNISEVQFIPGPQSTWRDIKTWGQHIYVTNETSSGVLVIDMNGAPNNITWYDWTPNIPGLGLLNSCHNLYIDEFGYCYLAGCNLNNGGMLIIDVFSIPGTPQFVSAAPNDYSHDVFTRDNIMYSSEINDGHLAIYDVTDKQDIKLINTQETPFTFTHNAWLNDASTVVFTTDEKPNAPVAAYDISDPDDIFELDQYVPIETLGDGVIPHNVHVWEDWLIISYYSDGGIIVDASRPENLIEVGNWDTFLGAGQGFQGVWGAYPYLPSGLVLLTDIGTGLYVCGVDYVRACWLEGKVTSSATGAPIFGVQVSINSTQPNLANTDLVGNYETGQALAGTFDVTFTASGYQSKTVQAVLENGELTILDVELDPFASINIPGQCLLESNGAPAPGAMVFLDGEVDFTATADDNGNFVIENAFLGDYTVYAGGWGYHLTVVDDAFTVDANAGGPHTIELTTGYKDDFAVDLGWAITGNANTGAWELGNPNGTTYQGSPSNPEYDIQTDFGNQCYVTGNGGGGAGDDDVDNGVTTLTSPVMDLTNYFDPHLSYHAWFFNAGGDGTPNDALTVRIDNGIETVVIETITNSIGAWLPATNFRLLDYISLTNNMRVSFETSDLANSGHLVEAAIDAFVITDSEAIAPFSASETNGCLPHTVQFADQSDSTATYVWTFEGGSPATSTEANPEVVYNSTGTFDVTLEVTTAAGNVFVIDRPGFVEVNETPMVSFDATVTGNQVALTNNSTNGGDYQWSFGDGTTSTENAPSHTFSATGTYTVTLTSSNNCGSDTQTTEIGILAIPPQSGFTADMTEGCAPFTVQFTDESVNTPTNWEWTFLGATPSISNEQNPTVVYNTPGTWSVSLTVSNAAGQSAHQESTMIVVDAAPTSNFTYTANGPIVDFINGSSNGDTYEWNFGDGNTSTEEQPTHTFAGIGEYEVTLTVTNDCGFVVFTQDIAVESATAVELLDETAFQLEATPNPFQGEMMVDYKLNNAFEKAQLVVTNVLGQEMISTPIAAASGSIILGNELTHSGVYFVQLIVDSKPSKALRVVKMD